jgi:holo-[acyl-carrier protein] synthase
MILGVGTDLVDIRRVEKTLARFGDRFVNRLFTAQEQQRCYRRPAPSHAFAQRFAAKEACAKALGTGFRRGVAWRDIEVGNLPSGQPVLTLTRGAAARLQAITPPGMTAKLSVSMSDEYPMAHAIVIIFASDKRTPAT